MPLTYVRGEWSRWAAPSGTVTLNQALWRSDGGATAVMRTGQTVTAGLTLAEFLNDVPGAQINTFAFSAPMGWDANRRRMLVGPTPGGGPPCRNFEINEFDFATGVWNPDGRPQDPYVRLIRKPSDPAGSYQPGEYYGANGNAVSAFLDPGHFYTALAKPDQTGTRTFPTSSHWSCGAIFMPTVGRFLYLPSYGTAFTDQGAQYAYFEWDPIARQWEGLPLDTIFNRGDYQTCAGIWSPVFQKVIFYNGYTLFSYNPTATPGARTQPLVDFSTLPGGGGTSNGFGTMLYDARRQRAVYIARQQESTAINYFFRAENLGGTPSVVPVTLTGALTNASIPRMPGFVYDPVADRYVIWLGGRTLYFVDPETFAVTSTTPATGMDPGTRAWGGTLNGEGFGHGFVYDAGSDLYLGYSASPAGLFNGINEAGVAVYAPLRAAPPVLAFTDLTQAPRSGNPATDKGQTANVHGAFVTLWGTNLGATQGGATLTVGGVAPSAVYYWGTAVPPFGGAATLYNAHQRLQCIVFQIAGSTPTGLQSIVVTVGGQVATGLSLTITTSGTTRLVSTDAGLSAAMAAMVDGDVTYVRAGTYNGVNLGLGSRVDNAHAPMVVAAYPTEAVTVGSPTSASFRLASSFTGFFMTYAKMSLYGANAFTPGDGSATPAITLCTRARAVGNLIQAPLADGSTGAVAVYSGQGDSSYIQVVGNELTNCGNPANFDALYHTLYFNAPRSVASFGVTTDQEVGWNYFHDNTANRAINYFNTPSRPSDVVAWAQTRALIHDNVIVNQVGDGILLSQGVVGENWIYNNLLINTGLQGPGTPFGGVAIDIRAQEPDNAQYGTPTNSGLPVNIHIFNNTILNAGYVGESTRGALLFAYAGVIDMHNNIFDQVAGLPYLSSAGFAPSAGQSSRNLWFGAGPAPAFDAQSVTANPQLVSPVPPHDLHLQFGSPARAAGLNLTSLAVGRWDVDGVARPNAAWDLGAYQFGSADTPPPPPPPVLSSLNPSMGPAGIQVTLLGNNFSTLPGGNTVRFGSTPAALLSEGAGAILAVVPALADGPYDVTVTTEAGVSNALPFSEVTLQAAGYGHPVVRTTHRRWS